MRRFVKEENLIQTLQNMSAGIEPIDMEAIRYTDPKKIKVKQESSSSSEDDKEEWGYSRPPKKVRPEFSSDSDTYNYESSYYHVMSITHRPKRKRQRIRLNDAMQRV